MSLFSKDIVQSPTALHQFHDECVQWVEKYFDFTYVYWNGDLERVEKVFNNALRIARVSKKFVEFGLHNPYLSCARVVSESMNVVIMVAITYLPCPSTCSFVKDREVFVKMRMQEPRSTGLEFGLDPLNYLSSFDN